MSQGVSVGFFPAPATLPGAPTAVPPSGAAPGRDLFASLLALLGQKPPAADAAPVAEAKAPAAPLLDLAALPDPEAPHEPGSTLLADLGAALSAARVALAGGETLDLALERKLAKTLDALAALLGLPVTAPPPPALPAAAAGALPDFRPPDAPVPLPLAANPAGLPFVEPPSAAAPMPGAAAPEGTVAAASAPAIPSPAPAAAALLQPTDPTFGQPVPPTTAVPPAPAPADLPAPFAHLAGPLAKLVDELQPLVPAIAEKLAVVAAKLAGPLPEAILAGLGIDGETEAMEPALRRALDAVAAILAPQPRAPAAPAPLPFAPAQLALPADPPDPADPVAPLAAEPTGESDTPPETTATRSASVPAARPPDAEPRPAHVPAATAAPAADAGLPDPLTAAAPASSATASAPAAARIVHAAYQAPLHQPNLPQVAFEIVRQFEAGNSRFQIRLDPPELGRIDVRLDLDETGALRARLTVDRPETLDLMQRDQRALQQALQQAGLDQSRTSLEFSLRQSPFARDGSGGDGRPSGSPHAAPDIAEAAAEPVPLTTHRGSASPGGLNLFV